MRVIEYMYIYMYSYTYIYICIYIYIHTLEQVRRLDLKQCAPTGKSALTCTLHDRGLT